MTNTLFHQLRISFDAVNEKGCSSCTNMTLIEGGSDPPCSCTLRQVCTKHIQAAACFNSYTLSGCLGHLKQTRNRTYVTSTYAGQSV